MVAAKKSTAAKAEPRKRLARDYDRAFARELARAYREQHPRPDRAVRRSDIGEALDWFAQHGTWEKSPRDLAPWNALAARVYYQRARGEAKRRAEWAADDEERLAIAKAVSAAKARGKKLTAVEVKTAARKAHEARAKEKVSVDDLIADTAESLTLGIKTVRVAIYRRKATK